MPFYVPSSCPFLKTPAIIIAPASFSCMGKKKTLPPEREKGIATMLLLPVSHRQSYQ